MKKIIISSLFYLVLNATSYAQEKPVRIGLKFDIPNVAGLSLEYATPLLDNKLAAAIDFSSISISAGETKVSFSYIEAGGNYCGSARHLCHAAVGHRLVVEGEAAAGEHFILLLDKLCWRCRRR